MSGQLSFTPLFGQLSVTPPYTSPSANKSSDRRNTRQYAVDLLSCCQPHERQHDRDAGHEDEQREDEVVEAQSLPFRVLELPTDNVTGCARNHALARQHFGERLGGPIRADNP